MRDQDALSRRERRLRAQRVGRDLVALRARGVGRDPRGRRRSRREFSAVLRRSARAARRRRARDERARHTLRDAGSRSARVVFVHADLLAVGLGIVAPRVEALRARHRRLAREAADARTANAREQHRRVPERDAHRQWLGVAQSPALRAGIPAGSADGDRGRRSDTHRELQHLNHRGWIARKSWQIRNRHAIGSVASRRGWSG